MGSKEQIPLRTFEGFLKQHAHDALSALEQRLFDTLFPLFQGRPRITDASSAGRTDDPDATLRARFAETYSPLIEIGSPEAVVRRFAGYQFPRRRYFALCQGAEGQDLQTLAHEFRAYRDPIEVGMVEVIDLAEGCNLVIKDVQVQLAEQTNVAVLIHEPEKLPPELHALDFIRLPGLKSPETFLYYFPYTVTQRRVPRTIDLRFPEVREWFYRTFRIPSESTDSAPVPRLPKALQLGSPSPTIALSRFHLEDGVAPVPESFWDMLPTLINPDLGGGSPADTGSTLWMVGNFMRQHDINALVFPSARCDSAVVFEDGEMKHWQGWNLVEFEGSRPLQGADSVMGVLSPWAWMKLPAGVRLHVPPADSLVAGSFAMENVVNYWASDYLGQIRALEVARSAHGQEPAPDERKIASQALAFRGFRIGALCLRWLRRALERVPANEVEQDVLELQGLALPYDLYPLTGRVIELWDEMQEKAVEAADMLTQSLRVTDLVCHSLRRRYDGQDIDLLTRVGTDIELMLCFLVGLSETEHTNVEFEMEQLGGGGEKPLQTRWLNNELRTRVREFYSDTLSELSGGRGRVRLLCEEGATLHDAICRYVRSESIASSDMNSYGP